jgi:acetylornithine deacetylase/succinyl-diaminopimelate desuccinylase-like protein
MINLLSSVGSLRVKGLLAGITMLSSIAVGWGAPAAPLAPTQDQELAHDILKELVQTNSTHEHGSTAVALIIQQQLLAAGFPPADVALMAPPDKPAKGSLVVRYRGKGRSEPVLYLGHLDVVEAKREDWSTDPFELVEKDGWFYGRGTLDMKDGDAALLETLIRLRREHFVPHRDIIVAFTADEEAGADANGPEFLLKEHRDLITAGMVFNMDGGGGGLKDGARQFFNRHKREDLCHLHPGNDECRRPWVPSRT